MFVTNVRKLSCKHTKFITTVKSDVKWILRAFVEIVAEFGNRILIYWKYEECSVVSLT